MGPDWWLCSPYHAVRVHLTARLRRRPDPDWTPLDEDTPSDPEPEDTSQ